MSTRIHPTALIEKNAQIGKDVEIAPYSILGPEVQIGDNTYIGPHSIIEFTEMGSGNSFTGHAFIGLPPQDYKYGGEKTKLIMGNDNIIREGVSIHRGSPLTGLTKIGSGCMFMANSHAGHDCRFGDNVIITNSSAAAGHVFVEDKVIISGLCAIHQFTRIGTLAMISGGSMVNQDIIPYVIAQGDRAKPVCLNIVGLKRNGIKSENIKSLKRAFKILFLEGLAFEKALSKLRSENLSPEAKHLMEFCEKSKRGVARPKTGIRK